MTAAQRDMIDQILRNAPFDLGGDVAAQRPILDQMLTSYPRPSDVRTTPGNLASVPVIFIDIADVEVRGTLFHIHGGGFVLGSAANCPGDLGTLRLTGTEGGCYVRAMDMVRQVIVFDAADLDAESRFWAGIFDGHVFRDDRFHCVINAAGEWRVGVQLPPNHVPPEWPDGAPQQVHVDLHVEDPRAAHKVAVGLGAKLLQPGNVDAREGHHVHADPAGHPFCIGWGHPSQEAVAAFVADRSSVDRA